MLNEFGQYIDQIHYVFNESKKYTFVYKCGRREYFYCLGMRASV